MLTSLMEAPLPTVNRSLESEVRWWITLSRIPMRNDKGASRNYVIVWGGWVGRAKNYIALYCKEGWVGGVPKIEYNIILGAGRRPGKF